MSSCQLADIPCLMPAGCNLSNFPCFFTVHICKIGHGKQVDIQAIKLYFHTRDDLRVLALNGC